MRLKMQMKKILLLLGAVSAGVLPVAAEVVPLSVSQLKTGPESTYRNGVFTSHCLGFLIPSMRRAECRSSWIL